MTFQQMIDIWPGMMRSGLRIGSPAWSNAWSTAPGGNLFDFIEKCDELNYRVDFVAVHCYWGGKSPINWYNDLKVIYEATGRPLWITEWNNGANWTTEWWPDADRTYTEANAQKQLNDIKGILQVLDTASFVERYFIYDWVEDCRAMVLGDTLTLAGEYYAANKSQIAYNKKNDVIPPPWDYNAPVLSYRYLSLSKKISLKWADSNGNLSTGIKIEKKVNDNSYETIYESDTVGTTYLDGLDSAISGRVSYRVSIKTVYGDYVTSNEVSYYQSQGIDTIQIGNFPYNNKDWNTTLFSSEYEEKPLVISGVPTFNNIMPLTHRVNSVSTRSFKFHLNTWDYQKDLLLTKSDYISLMALPSGSYDFKGLAAVVSAVPNVAGEWVSVVFDQPFDTIPVVFCTQVSNNTFFPTMPALRNITRQGFELKVKCEEKMPSTSIITETLNFLAIECGKGAIGNFRITVGQTTEGEKGVSDDPVLLDFDPSYAEPVLFASMLTTVDDFSSVLRYYSSGNAQFTIIKQREYSGTISAIHEDKLGWMVIDLSEGQPVNVTYQKSPAEEIVIAPNPVSTRLVFNFSHPMQTELYDMYGKLQCRTEVLNSLDVSFLPAGAYFLKVDGFPIKKFIKQ
jgi:hypothetical protein